MTIKQKRLALGLTQIEVAKKVGVSMVSYQLWERGATTPSEDNLKKLEEVLKSDKNYNNKHDTEVIRKE